MMKYCIDVRHLIQKSVTDKMCVVIILDTWLMATLHIVNSVPVISAFFLIFLSLKWYHSYDTFNKLIIF
jgi:hypothetical protein